MTSPCEALRRAAEVPGTAGEERSRVLDENGGGAMALHRLAAPGARVFPPTGRRPRAIRAPCRDRRVAVLAAFLVLAGLLLPGAARSEMAVARHAFALGVEDREPVGVSEVFVAGSGKVTFFTHVTGVTRPGEILHVWIYDGREVGAVPLHVDRPAWRTWSSKTIPPELRGDWLVEVRDAAGAVLLTATFRAE